MESEARIGLISFYILSTEVCGLQGGSPLNLQLRVPLVPITSPLRMPPTGGGEMTGTARVKFKTGSIFVH